MELNSFAIDETAGTLEAYNEGVAYRPVIETRADRKARELERYQAEREAALQKMSAPIGAVATSHQSPNITEENWREFASCKDLGPDAFFPGKGGDSETPKSICKGCPVEEPCLEAALNRTDQFGIFGGNSERQRRKLRKARRIAMN